MQQCTLHLPLQVYDLDPALTSYIIIIITLSYQNSGSIARRSAYFGRGNGPILLADLFCSGLEESLLGCNRNAFGTLNCAHFEDAGVTCESKHNVDTVQFRKLYILFIIII